jgi:hypothetical protein
MLCEGIKLNNRFNSSIEKRRRISKDTYFQTIAEKCSCKDRIYHLPEYKMPTTEWTISKPYKQSSSQETTKISTTFFLKAQSLSVISSESIALKK